MATLSKPLTCDVCGAPLSVPADDAILSATCAHCQHVQPLPDADRRRKVQDERRARAEQERQRQQYEAAHERTMRSSSRMSLWITLGSFAFAIIIAAVTAGPSILGAWTTVGALTGSPPTAPIPIPLRPVVPSAPPVVIAVTPPPPPRDPAVLAETARTRLGAQMRERVAAGCRRVIMPPEVVTGPKSMTATMVMNRQCVVLLAVAGGPETSLTATMSNPFGEPVPAPTPGPELALRHCPTVAGPHPIRVTPSTNDPYAVAAIECPATAASPRSPCPPGTCTVRPGGRCERPTGQLGNMCCRCGANGRCASPCRCNGPEVPVATPDGPRPIRALRVGDLVYSVEGGARVAVPVAAIRSRAAPRGGFVRVELDDGSSFVTSAVHPLADGRTVGALGREQGVRSVSPADRPADRTFDILAASTSGAYFVGDLLFASTLRPSP